MRFQLQVQIAKSLPKLSNMKGGGGGKKILKMSIFSFWNASQTFPLEQADKYETCIICKLSHKPIHGHRHAEYISFTTIQSLLKQSTDTPSSLLFHGKFSSTFYFTSDNQALLFSCPNSKSDFKSLKKLMQNDDDRHVHCGRYSMCRFGE